MLKKRDKMGYGEDMNYQIVKSIEKMNSHSDKLFYEQLYLQKDPVKYNEFKDWCIERGYLNELYKKTRGYIYLYNIFAYNCIFVFNRLFFRKRNRSKCNRDNVFNNVLLPDYMLFYYIYLVYKVHRT